MSDILLLPQPRQLELGEGYTQLRADALIVVSDRRLLFEAQYLQRGVERYRWEWSIVSVANHEGLLIRLQLEERQTAQAYTLTVRDGEVVITGDHAGVFYGVCTLLQLIQNDSAALPQLQIEDSPDIAARGVMLDISRDKVPTMATLYNLVDQLAALKINQLQLYIEHTFAYQQHQQVWQHASPLTAQEILELDAYCAQRHVDLVPNQNSLGHMERWLKYAPYRPLSEMEHGFITPWGEPRDPSTVDPQDPKSLELFAGLYEELLPNFRSNLFNVGCDEPWELGQGKSKDAVAARGGRVYLDWMLKLHKLVGEHERQMMFWGDIIVNHPELVPELPDDVLVLDWGYESTHPFMERAKLYADAGKPFYLCPGTSSWNSLIGRSDNAMGNLLGAAQAGVEYGASGFLNTDWGDNGHWQPLPTSYLGFAYGAAVSWYCAGNETMDLPAALDRFVFHDAAGVMGQTVYDLGNIYKRVGPEHVNGLSLAYLLQVPRNGFDDAIQRMTEWGGAVPDTSQETLRNVITQIDALIYAMGQHKMQRADADLIVQEFTQAAQLARHGAKWLDTLKGYNNYSVVDLQAELNSLMDIQREVWLARNRRGGLEDSMRRFETLRSEYDHMQH